MRKAIIGGAAVAASVAALLLVPGLARRGLKQCHEMMAEMRCGGAGEEARSVPRPAG